MGPTQGLSIYGDGFLSLGPSDLPKLPQGKWLWTETQEENQYRHPSDYISFFVQGRIVYGFGMVNP